MTFWWWDIFLICFIVINLLEFIGLTVIEIEDQPLTLVLQSMWRRAVSAIAEEPIHRKYSLDLWGLYVSKTFYSCRRSRPTLKPASDIVSKVQQFVDIYRHPPTRPDPLYPQPTPDRTAAKCRKDVCLLPDCYCGGKDIPGNFYWLSFFDVFR